MEKISLTNLKRDQTPLKNKKINFNQTQNYKIDQHSPIQKHDQKHDSQIFTLSPQKKCSTQLKKIKQELVNIQNNLRRIKTNKKIILESYLKYLLLDLKLYNQMNPSSDLTYLIDQIPIYLDKLVQNRERKAMLLEDKTSLNTRNEQYTTQLEEYTIKIDQHNCVQGNQIQKKQKIMQLNLSEYDQIINSKSKQLEEFRIDLSKSHAFFSENMDKIKQFLAFQERTNEVMVLEQFVTQKVDPKFYELITQLLNLFNISYILDIVLEYQAPNKEDLINLFQLIQVYQNTILKEFKATINKDHELKNINSIISSAIHIQAPTNRNLVQAVNDNNTIKNLQNQLQEVEFVYLKEFRNISIERSQTLGQIGKKFPNLSKLYISLTRMDQIGQFITFESNIFLILLQKKSDVFSDGVSHLQEKVEVDQLRKANKINQEMISNAQQQISQLTEELEVLLVQRERILAPFDSPNKDLQNTQNCVNMTECKRRKNLDLLTDLQFDFECVDVQLRDSMDFIRLYLEKINEIIQQNHQNPDFLIECINQACYCLKNRQAYVICNDILQQSLQIREKSILNEIKVLKLKESNKENTEITLAKGYEENTQLETNVSYMVATSQEKEFCLPQEFCSPKEFCSPHTNPLNSCESSRESACFTSTSSKEVEKVESFTQLLFLQSKFNKNNLFQIEVQKLMNKYKPTHYRCPWSCTPSQVTSTPEDKPSRSPWVRTTSQVNQNTPQDKPTRSRSPWTRTISQVTGQNTLKETPIKRSTTPNKRSKSNSTTTIASTHGKKDELEQIKQGIQLYCKSNQNSLKNLENYTIQQLQKSGFCMNFFKFDPISRSLIICKYNHKATHEISSKDRKYSPKERKNYRSLPLTSIKRIVIPDITLSILQSQKNKETKYRNCDRYIFQMEVDKQGKMTFVVEGHQKTLQDISQQLLLRFMNKRAISNKIFALWSKSSENDLSRPDLDPKNHELIKYTIFSEDNKQFILNEKFATQMRGIFNNGYQQFLQQNGEINNIQVINEVAILNWKSLYGRISQQSVARDYTQSKNLTNVLISGRLIVKNSSNITPDGFKFILSSAKNQLSTFLKYYTDYMIEKVHQSQQCEILNFIINLSLLSPLKYYQKGSRSAIQKEIISDFQQIGLIWENPYDKSQITVTRLLHNFMFSDTILKVDIKCQIIVETNFRVYIYLNDQQEEEHIYDLVKRFTEIKYRFQNMIVCDLTQEKVQAAFAKNITAELIIDFFNKCVSSARVNYDQKKKISIQAQDQTNEIRKPGLEFLKLYNVHTENGHIPANIVQTLELWEKEKNVDYRQVIQNAKEAEEKAWEGPDEEER